MSNLLNGYSVLLPKYQELWGKYGKTEKSKVNTSLVISTQEDSIKWSLKLQTVFDILAKELGKTPEEVRQLFIEGINGPTLLTNKIYAGLANISHWVAVTPEQIAERFGLFFDINSIDDLFLSYEDDKNSVIEIE